MPDLVFDQYVLNLDQRLLFRDGDVVDLQPLVFDLLVMLAQRPRKVVSKAELLPAVWRSTFVTDSVVARAVMKARRALLDDASAPKLLRTVHRIGYALEADVVQRAPKTTRVMPPPADASAARRLALLPVKNETGLAALDWVEQGLTRLLQQWLEGQGHVNLVTTIEMQEAFSATASDQDPMAQVCLQLGATEALRSQLSWHEGAYTLSCWRGNAMPGRLVFEGAALDPLDLARRMADTLMGQTQWGAPVGADTFWQEQIASAMRMQQSGQPAQALALLEHSVTHADSCLPMDLLRVRLLCQCNRFSEALTHIERLLQSAVALPKPVHVDVLDMRGECLHQCDQLREAMRSFEEALALSLHVPEAHPMRPDILGRAARVACRLQDPGRAIALAESAVAEADRLGHLGARVRAALWLCGVLSQLDQRHRAQSAVTQAIELGQRSGVMEYEAKAWRYQSALQNTLGHNRDAHESIKRSIALCLRCGNEYELVWGLMMELVVCVESGLLDEAERLAQDLSERSDLPATQRDYVELLAASVDWRSGREGPSVSRLTRLAGGLQTPVNHTRMQAHAMLVLSHIHLGQLEEAQLCMRALQGCSLAGYVTRREAALALAKGDRQHAITLLREAWRTGKTSGGEGIRITVDLTWMLLENAPVGFEDAELESLFAHVLDLSDELPEHQILRAAYVLRRQPSKHSLAAWDEVMERASVLKRRCPMMLTRSYREAMATRAPPRLGELLSRVCW